MGENMKKIIFTTIVFILVFLIYFFNINEKIYYVSLGDFLSYGINNFNKIENSYSENIKKYYESNLENYVNYSLVDDYRVVDLINDINYNKEIIYKNKKYKLQNLLIKANYMTLSIGMNDLIYKKNLTYNYVDQLLIEIDNLFKLIRKYNKDTINFLSFYNSINNIEIIEYSNKRIKKICERNDINYIDISNLNSYIIKDLYPTNSGYMYITNQILNFTKK